jgi:hypothetical protein
VAKWQTRSTQNAFPKGVRVQVPPSARKYRKSSGNTPEDFLLSVPVCFANYPATFIQKR